MGHEVRHHASLPRLVPPKHTGAAGEEVDDREKKARHLRRHRGKHPRRRTSTQHSTRFGRGRPPTVKMATQTVARMKLFDDRNSRSRGFWAVLCTELSTSWAMSRGDPSTTETVLHERGVRIKMKTAGRSMGGTLATRRKSNVRQ